MSERIFKNSQVLSGAIVPDAPAKEKPVVETDVLASVDHRLLDASYVYVHCYFNNPADEMLIRIWRSTFLIDRTSGARSELIHAENISYAPRWTIVPKKTQFSFLLIFSALPKDCTVFDLLEDIPQTGGFFVSGIKRNSLDVYHVRI
jgi:hypothetical protein